MTTTGSASFFSHYALYHHGGRDSPFFNAAVIEQHYHRSAATCALYSIHWGILPPITSNRVPAAAGASAAFIVAPRGLIFANNAALSHASADGVDISTSGPRGQGYPPSMGTSWWDEKRGHGHASCYLPLLSHEHRGRAMLSQEHRRGRAMLVNLRCSFGRARKLECPKKNSCTRIKHVGFYDP